MRVRAVARGAVMDASGMRREGACEEEGRTFYGERGAASGERTRRLKGGGAEMEAGPGSVWRMFQAGEGRWSCERAEKGKRGLAGGGRKEGRTSLEQP